MYNSWTTDDLCDQLNTNGFDYAVSPFTKNAITGDLLPMVSEDHLKEMGITSIGKRLLLLQWIRDTAGIATPPSSAPVRASRQPRVEFDGANEYDGAPPQSQSKTRQEQPSKPANTAKRAQTASSPPANDKESLPKCKRDHDKMVEQIRAARKLVAYQKAVEEGRAVGPPPELPPIEEPEGLVQCPNCGRKFSEEAAKHHFPVCERMNFKKNNPPNRRK